MPPQLVGRIRAKPQILPLCRRQLRPRRRHQQPHRPQRLPGVLHRKDNPLPRRFPRQRYDETGRPGHIRRRLPGRGIGVGIHRAELRRLPTHQPRRLQLRTEKPPVRVNIGGKTRQRHRQIKGKPGKPHHKIRQLLQIGTPVVAVPLFGGAQTGLTQLNMTRPLFPGRVHQVAQSGALPQLNAPGIANRAENHHPSPACRCQSRAGRATGAQYPAGLRKLYRNHRRCSRRSIADTGAPALPARRAQTSYSRTAPATISGAPVTACTSAAVQPGAASRSIIP